MTDVTRPNELLGHVAITGEQQAKRALKEVGDEADKTGGQFEEMGAEAGHLSKRLAELKESHKALLVQLDQGGDEKTLLKQIRAVERQSRTLERLQKKLLADAGPTFMASFMGSLKEAAGAIPEVLIPALVVTAIAAAPVLGATIGGAVLGGIGLGGIIGGFFAATKDPRVREAASKLGETASGVFKAVGVPFVQPAIESLQMLENAAVRVADKLGEGMRSLAPILRPFVMGLTGLVEEMMPGLIKAFDQAKPVFRALANELPEIGAALGDMFGTMSDEADGAAMALSDLFRFLGTTLRMLGDFTATMSAIYEWIVRTSRATGEWGEKWFAWLPLTQMAFKFLKNDIGGAVLSLDAAKDPVDDFAFGLQAISREAERAAAELDAMKAASDALFDKYMDLDQATLNYHKTLMATHKELAEGARILNFNTEEGLDNIEAIEERIRVINLMREKESESAIGIAGANQRYTERLQLLRQELIQMGFNSEAIDEFTAKYLAIPAARDIELRIKVGGDVSAWSMLRAAERQLTAHMGPLETRAAGGPVEPHRLYRVNETGVEFLQTGSQGGYVLSADKTKNMMGGRSGGASFSDSGRRTGDAVKDTLMDLLWPDFLKRIRVDGGDLTSVGAA